LKKGRCGKQITENGTHFGGLKKSAGEKIENRAHEFSGKGEEVYEEDLLCHIMFERKKNEGRKEGAVGVKRKSVKYNKSGDAKFRLSPREAVINKDRVC